MPSDTPLPLVLHLRSSCGLYGAEGVIRTLVQTCNGPTATVCFEDSREPHTELCTALAADGFETAVLPSRGAVDPFVPARYSAILRRYRPAVIHCHDYKSVTVAALASRGIRLVFTMHGDLRETVGSGLLRRLGNKALRQCDAVVGVSDETVADAREYGVRPERIHLIRNAVDTRRFQPCDDRPAARAALGLPPDGFLIGAVGRLSEEKGQPVLLEAAAKLGFPWHLALAGDGPLDKDLRALAARLGIAGRVHFLGRVENVERVYHALDVLALPSHREGLPLTVVEAAACAVPVAATDVGDVGRAVIDGQTGLLVPPGDPAALAGALTRIEGDAALQAAMGQAGREHVVASFGAEGMARAYEALYLEGRRV